MAMTARDAFPYVVFLVIIVLILADIVIDDR
jgi:hypothetical protein